MPETVDLPARVVALRSAVAQHKRNIRHERQELGAAADELRRLEQECRRRGIGFAQMGDRHVTFGLDDSADQT
jgi:hypothetical protein